MNINKKNTKKWVNDLSEVGNKNKNARSAKLKAQKSSLTWITLFA